jgi:hypothetical protein
VSVGATIAGSILATPIVGLIAGRIGDALGILGWWLSDNVVMGLNSMKNRIEAERREAEREARYEEEKRLREAEQAARDLESRLKSQIYDIKDLEKTVDSWIYAKQYDQALSLMEQIEAKIRDMRKTIEESKDKLPSEQDYVALLESLAAAENLLYWKKALIQERNGGRYLMNAGTKAMNALKILSDFHENWYEKRKNIDVSVREEREAFESYQKTKENYLRGVRTITRLANRESQVNPHFTYQKSKLTHKTGKSYEDPQLYRILRAIADAYGKPTATPEELPDIAGLPYHVLDFPVIAKLLTWIMHRKKTPLAAFPNSYWEHKSGKEYTALDRYLMLVALQQAGVSVTEVAHLKEYELEAILRFRQYMSEAAKRGYFWPWEYECYTRFKELMLVDDDDVAAILSKEIPEEAEMKIWGERVLDIGGETIISPYELKVEVG